MKIKSLAMFAMSGLLAASIAYVAPAMAADDNDMGQSSQQAADAQNSGDQGATTNDSSSTGNSNSSSNSSTSDQGSPDTATGDDDY
jgi:hypothetical protein